MELVQPDIAYKDSYLHAVDEDGEQSFGVNVDGVNFSLRHTDFSAYVRSLKQRADGVGLPPGYVPDTILWLIDKGEFIGRISIRHSLTDRLLHMGGHIGYGIRTSKRRKGYGKEILRLGLMEAKKLGLSRALLTCDETNVGSKKIIEANGGVLEDRRPNPEGGPDKLRYWIQL